MRTQDATGRDLTIKPKISFRPWVQGYVRTMLAGVTSLAILLAGEVMLTISSVTAQPVAKSHDDLVKEFQRKRQSASCVNGTVKAAGYSNLFEEDRIVVEVSCSDNAQLLSAFAPKAREQEILSIALAAMSTGKPVLVGLEDDGEIGIFGLVAPK